MIAPDIPVPSGRMMLSSPMDEVVVSLSFCFDDFELADLIRVAFKSQYVAVQIEPIKRSENSKQDGTRFALEAQVPKALP